MKQLLRSASIAVILLVFSVPMMAQTLSKEEYKLAVKQARMEEKRLKAELRELRKLTKKGVIVNQEQRGGIDMNSVVDGGKNGTYISIGAFIAQKEPGVIVTEDGSSTTYQIRGAGYTGSPLLVLNGIEVDNFNNVSPGEVEKVEILKGTAAIGAWGAKGYNGVIMLTTRDL